MRLTRPWWLFLATVMLAIIVYAPGLPGGWLFDDYPNIVNNQQVQPQSASVSELVGAALSSPSSRFKRPLASLSFAANYLAGGLDPFGWKLVNLLIHLLNGLFVFLLVRRVLRVVGGNTIPIPAFPLKGKEKNGSGFPFKGEEKDGFSLKGADSISSSAPALKPSPSRGGFGWGWGSIRSRRIAVRQQQQEHHPPPGLPLEGEGEEGPSLPLEGEGEEGRRWFPELAGGNGSGMLAALIAGAWLLLPINLTGVLYVVQRMESLANLFVLVGLWGYVVARQRMLVGKGGFGLCIASILLPMVLGLMAKETAVMLPLYALLIEWIVFRFAGAPFPNVAAGAPLRRDSSKSSSRQSDAPAGAVVDRRLVALYVIVLVLPMIAGLALLLPGLLQPGAWATRDFTLGMRLLSEARIVVDYIGWTLLPLPQWLSFYHDDFTVSQSLWQPWTTFASMLVIAALLALAWWQRRRRPLLALGIALYFGCHLLTATILPLELIYEHRNYFASLGLLLAVLPLLAAAGALPLVRRAVLAMLGVWWIALTAFTAYNWGNPLRLASDLGIRAPQSPRAQYELGRTLLMLSNYDPASPYTPLVYAPLERAAALPRSSILPQQALLFFNARMGRPMKDEWWDSLIAKLASRPPGVQDDSSLGAMTKCAISGNCPFDRARMVQAFEAALSHPNPSARLMATYGDYAWNVLNNYQLGVTMTERAIRAKPGEPAYRVTLARMATVLHHPDVVREQIEALQGLNYGGRLDGDIAELRKLLPQAARSVP